MLFNFVLWKNKTFWAWPLLELYFGQRDFPLVISQTQLHVLLTYFRLRLAFREHGTVREPGCLQLAAALVTPGDETS